MPIWVNTYEREQGGVKELLVEFDYVDATLYDICKQALSILKGKQKIYISDPQMINKFKALNHIK